MDDARQWTLKSRGGGFSAAKKASVSPTALAKMYRDGLSKPKSPPTTKARVSTAAATSSGLFQESSKRPTQFFAGARPNIILRDDRNSVLSAHGSLDPGLIVARPATAPTAPHRVEVSFSSSSAQPPWSSKPMSLAPTAMPFFVNDSSLDPTVPTAEASASRAQGLLQTLHHALKASHKGLLGAPTHAETVASSVLGVSVARASAALPQLLRTLSPQLTQSTQDWNSSVLMHGSPSTPARPRAVGENPNFFSRTAERMKMRREQAEDREKAAAEAAEGSRERECEKSGGRECSEKEACKTHLLAPP